MKKIILITLTVALLPAFVFCQTPDDDLFYHITQDMNTFSTFFSIKEGSSGEKEAVNFISERFKKLGINFSVYSLSGSQKFFSRSVIIDAVFKGTSGNEIFLIFPLDINSVPVTPDAAFNLSSALALAERLKHEKLENTVHLLFPGAESGTGKNYPLGSREYLSNYYPKHNSAFFYFNIKTIPDSINIATAGTGNISPLWLLQKSIASLKTSEIPFTFRQEQNLIYRLALNDSPSLLDPYLDNSYPAILFQSKIHGKDSTSVSEKTVRYLQFLNSIAADKQWKVQSSLVWDKHYLLIMGSKRIIYIPEKSYVIFLIFLFSLILLYPFAATGRFKKYAKTIIKHIWTIPVLFGTVFLFLLVSTLSVKSILSLRNFESLWKYVPFIALVFKLSLASFLFLLFVRLFKFFNFSHRGSFYSASAIVFILADVILVLAIDISFAFYLVPVLFSVFLFTVVKNKRLKLMFLIISTIILVFGITKMFTAGSYNVIRIFLLSEIYGNLLITANLLPILLMIYRIRFLFHHSNPKSAKKQILIIDISLGIASVSLYLYLFLFNPFSHGNLQPLTVTEITNIDKETRLVSLESPAPLGTFTLKAGGTNAVYSIRNTKLSINTDAVPPYPEINIEKNKFLNRSKYILEYSYNLQPDRLRIQLFSDREIIVYDSNYPYSENEDSTMITFNTGYYPPEDFKITFTLPEDFNGELRITGEYRDQSTDISVKNHDFDIRTVQYFKKKTLITNSD